MSYEALLEDGSGKIAVRVSIPGLPIEFVSDPSMETTTIDGRRRVCCLPPMGEGIVFEEKINIPEATADVTGNRIQLYETDDEDLSQLFNALAETETYLTASVLEDNFQLPVLSATGFAADDVVHLGTEACVVREVAAGVLHLRARGHWDTVAQAHYSMDANVSGGLRVVTSAPTRIRGRRLNIFLYGEGDDPTGDGTQVWRGKVTSEAQLEAGATWSFGADNVLAVLRNKIGNEIEAHIETRGAYYHWAAPLAITIVEDGVATTPLELYGFYETNVPMESALQLALDEIASGLDSTYTVIDEAGAWNIQLRVGASTTTVDMFIHSPVDGGAIASVAWKQLDGTPVTALVANTTYVIDWVRSQGAHSPDPTARQCPRGFFGLPPENFSFPNAFYSDEHQQAAFPDNRIYLGAPVSSDWTAVQIKWPDSTSATGFEEDSTTIDALDTTGNWIQPRARRVVPGVLYNGSQRPEIKFGRTLAIGSLADCIAGLTHDAPRFANRFTLPAIWEDDFADILDVRAVLDAAAAGRAFLSSRIYTIFSPTDIDKFFSHHLRALTCYPCLDDEGRITFRRFQVPNASTTAIESLDDEIWDALATLAPEEQGTYNVVQFKTGYSAIDDKHTGETFEVRDVRAFAEEQEQHPLEIAMQSVPTAGDSAITAGDAASLADALLGYFSSPYKMVQSIAVSWQMFPTRCGDVVAVSSQYLPAFTGLRPMTEVIGIVVGRRWALGEAFGTLDIIVSPQNVAGYAPAAFVDTGAFSNVSGNTWDITITTGRYAPDGMTEDQFFITGDLVRLVTYDSESPTEKLGTVVSVNEGTHVIRVAFTTALTSPELSQWWLVFQSYSALTTAQRVYCVIAGNDGSIGSGAQRARTYAA